MNVQQYHSMEVRLAIWSQSKFGIQITIKKKIQYKHSMESERFLHISSTNYMLPCLSKMVALQQNVANCQNTLTALTLGWRIFLQDV